MKTNILCLFWTFAFVLLGFKALPVSAMESQQFNFNATMSIDSCDQIVTQNGDIINGKILEIGLKEIRYKKCDNINGPIIVIPRKDVLSVKYANGATDKIPVRKNNGLAIASFVLGISSMIVSFNYAGLIGLLASILGIIGLMIIKNKPNKFKGKGFAIWGVTLGALAAIIVIILAYTTF